MRVYHYINGEYGLQSIEKKRLKIAKLMELNDPFEFLGVNLQERTLRIYLSEMKERLANMIGFLCFSTNQFSPPQWAHYGDNHKGLCLGFEIPTDELRKVKYLKSRPKVEKEKLDNLMYLEKLLEKKSIHWSYEREWRYVTTLDGEKEDNLYFKDFSDILKLKEVYIGANSKITKDDIKPLLNKYNNEVKLFYTRPAFGSFKIVKNISRNKLDA